MGQSGGKGTSEGQACSKKLPFVKRLISKPGWFKYPCVKYTLLSVVAPSSADTSRR